MACCRFCTPLARTGDLGLKFANINPRFPRCPRFSQAVAGFLLLSEQKRREKMSETPAPKETKAQRMERLKREKNPWEAFDEVREFAREGRSSVVPEWASLTSSGGASIRRATAWARPAARAEKALTTEWFMMRIGIPNGIVSASQLRNHWRNHAQVCAQPGRHYGAPEHSAALADH